MKEILEQLYQHQTLSREQAKQILIDITTDKYNDYQIASFLTAFIMRNIQLEELIGFREALLLLCKRVDVSDYHPMDLCGTGGDGKNTFNISTLSAFVVAGAGIPVAKHGNYGVSSISGSSNVLEKLGVKFTADEKVLKSQLEAASICFLHAPLFHPAMKRVAPVRKGLGVKTFFNMLGPLVNPCQPKVQLTGVFNLELARLYQYLLQEESIQFTILYSLDGYDEVSLTNGFKSITERGESLLDASFFQMNQLTNKDLYGGETVEDAVKIFLSILKNKGTDAQNNVVIANAAMAIQTYYPDREIEDCMATAKNALFSGKAFEQLQNLLAVQNSLIN